ncbi:MAG: START domain-containing protein, partial [Gammaproteobacteria bacterium]|nr:START domain-containing protein [Gammaproteobacteria bacterium]
MHIRPIAMRPLRCSLLVSVLSLFPLLTNAAAEEDGWELKRDREGIQVYTRDVEGSPYDEVRTVTIADDVRLTSFVALIADAEACPDWADRCAESYVVDQVSDTEVYVYTHNDMPFPVRDRDVVSHVIWTQDAETLIV